MDSNIHSTSPASDLKVLVAELDGLAAQDPDRLAASARAERVLILRGLGDRLEGHWLSELAVVDAGGAAGAEQGIQAPSRAGWLRGGCGVVAGPAADGLGHGQYGGADRAGPVRWPPQGNRAGLDRRAISPAHAAVLAHGTHDLADHTAAEAEPVLVEAARRLDPPRLRKAVGYLGVVADPEGEHERAERRHDRRGLWLSSTWEGMVAVNGLLAAQDGQTVLAALEPLARPATAQDTRAVVGSAARMR